MSGVWDSIQTQKAQHSKKDQTTASDVCRKTLYRIYVNARAGGSATTTAETRRSGCLMQAGHCLSDVINGRVRLHVPLPVTFF